MKPKRIILIKHIRRKTDIANKYTLLTDLRQIL